MGSKYYRRRSKRGTKKFTKRKSKQLYRKKFKARRRHKRKNGLSSHRMGNLQKFADYSLVKIYDKSISDAPIQCIDYNTAVQDSDTNYWVLNANPANGNCYYINGVMTRAFSGARYTSAVQGVYNRLRPCAAVLDVTVRFADDGLPANGSTLAISRPIVIWFFVTTGTSGLGNYWNGTTPIAAETIPEMKYRWERTLTAPGGKSEIRFKQYVDFSKVSGIANNQFMYDDNYCCSTGSAANPTKPIYMHMVAYDYSSTAARTYLLEWSLKQYTKAECLRLQS